ncbi:gag/pol protein [Cucumis melo var. makuwa]|uniref:Gag/pol protein n=1 Tax=Cucumis melo var. makuwa TaxID=1194695 RepID=A0A5D3BD52_CUCMM|nr:gag/pol protein [Cucumis melo var. makuwa]
MILVIADLRFVLMEECSSLPTKNASQSVRDAYDRWTAANDKARLYILASMSDILSKKHEIMKRKGGKGNGPTVAAEGKGKAKVAIKGKCFHCNVDAHWKRNCPKYLAKKKEKEVATNHVCSSLQETSSFKQLEESEVTLKVGTRDVISARAVGDAKYGYLYLMEHKSEALEKFKEYKAEVENLLSKKIKILRCDRGGEYMDLRFQDYMIEHEIQSQLSAPVETAVHILNNVPSKSVSETPLELWRGRKPSLSHFRIWGCPKHVLVTNPKKLELRSRLCQFVGYPKETRGGLFFDPQENRVFVSTNATFLVVDEVGPSSRVDKTTTSGKSHPSQSLRMPRRSGRVISQPNRYLGLTETHVVIPDDGVEDQLSYKQAMNDVDKDRWVKAMDLEMESMYFNSVWELVDLPEGVKPIGCKWIIREKRDSAGKVQTFKARLVAKGYT